MHTHTDTHTYIIITNYVHGGDLFALLFKQVFGCTVNFHYIIVIYFIQKKLLTPADQYSISDQTAQGLAYMHCLNPPLIHWDVKPMNILVSYCVTRLLIKLYLCTKFLFR